MSKTKTPRESETIMTEIVLPNDTNALHNLRGGKILHWMDIASAIAAGRHAEAVVVTASVDSVSFENPIKLGDVVTIEAPALGSLTNTVRLSTQAPEWTFGTAALMRNLAGRGFL